MVGQTNGTRYPCVRKPNLSMEINETAHCLINDFYFNNDMRFHEKPLKRLYTKPYYY